MQDTSHKQNQPAASGESSARTSEDVAQQIINHAHSEKMNALVREFCDILDKTRKEPGSVRLPDVSAKSNKGMSR
jgi:hypothetical protein